MLAFGFPPGFCWLVQFSLWFVPLIFVGFPLFLVTAEFNGFPPFLCLSATWFCHSGVEATVLTQDGNM